MSVLLLPPIFQFFDNNGDPLANGFVDVFAAGTTTRQATYTSAAGTVEAPNPIQLNAAGRPTSGGGAIWGEGSYKFIVRDANGVQVGDVLDNVTSFSGLVTATNAYAELFSGNGTQTVFTTSNNLGTDPKGLLVSVASGLQEIAQNGSFSTDTLWTKGAGWTIGSGVATATGAISTGISQVPVLTVVAGQAYAVTYTITRSAGGLIPSIGGQNGVERTASGTYREIIIAAASTPIAFTGNAFTGTLDNVSITKASSENMALLPTSAYTINGTTLTFATAPASGVSNIDVRAPSLLVGAASSAASLAQVYAANALTSQTAAATSAANAAISASSAAGYAAARNQWTFSTTTTMANPGTANLRLNNAAFASVTAIAISDLSANVGNPDLSGWISTWDDAGGSNRGSIFIFKDNGNFAIYNVNSALIDNTTWWQVPVTYVSGAGSFSASDAILIGFSAAGTTLVSGGITQLTGDVVASGAGSVVATIASGAITTAKIAAGSVHTTKIEDLAVTTIKIADANVTTAKIADNAVDNSKLAQSAAFTVSGNNTNVTANKQNIPKADLYPQSFQIGGTVAANALTATLQPTPITFRSATVSSGAINNRIVATALSLTVPSGATLGTINAIQSRLVLLAIDNSGTVELAIVNISGGNQLDETNLISTTAISAGSTAANVIYSTTARTSVPYRVVGFIESTQATAGTWATSPSTVQGAGGQAVTTMGSIGYSQTWQNVVSSRAFSTTYYNTTGRPILVNVSAGTANGGVTLVINGITVASITTVAGYSNAELMSGIVPPGGSYSVVPSGASPTFGAWAELR
jgi:hypothetical protein